MVLVEDTLCLYELGEPYRVSPDVRVGTLHRSPVQLLGDRRLFEHDPFRFLDASRAFDKEACRLAYGHGGQGGGIHLSYHHRSHK